MIQDIITNIVSDFIFLLIVVLLGWIFYRLTQRTQLLRFFGVEASRRIVVYLSNLRIIPGGAVGIDGQGRSYQGSAIAFGELLVANRFRDLFNYILPSLADRPGLLSRLLISDVQVVFLPSPIAQNQVEGASSFVSLGSPAYNAASGLVETQLHSRVRFMPNGAAIHVENIPPITDTTYGFVERIIDREHRRNIFYAAGLSELGTAGAANFLATEWARLNGEFGNARPFLIMLRFDQTDFRRWTIVFEN